MADFLLELFSEEIPARMQADAIEHLKTALGLYCTKYQITDSGWVPQGLVTPRRLAIIADLPTTQPDVTIEHKGPKVGAPEAALQGFLKKTGLSANQLEQRDGIYFAAVHQKGKPTAELLKTMIEEILASFPWPKSMRWGAGDATWVRPLHSILCIFDGKVIPVTFGGVKAGNQTRGHRFLSPAAITINNPGDYEAALEKAHVIAGRDKRKANILAQAEKAAAEQKLVFKKDSEEMKKLLEEVTGLVEWPVVLVGTIDHKFMDLPKEVLVSEMRAHQKYFALEKEGGALSDKFLITANMVTQDGGKAVIAGNERVLRARLSDGRFFWDQDRKKPLAEMAKGLATVTYHAKLGSIADKVSRIKTLAVQLADRIEADKKLVERAAALCKADLVSGMVGEFPELQGVMGYYYALDQKEDSRVADAIRDHYKPQGPNDAVPTQAVSRCIALADKLDTLVSMFAIGEKPTGSKDPFALRRAALGVIRIILENNIRLPLKTCFSGVPAKDIALRKAHEKLVDKTEADLHGKAHKVGKYLTVNESAYADIEDAVPANLADMLYDFFIDRLKVQLKDSGIRHDVIAAVVSDGDDDLVRIVARAKALQDFLGTDDGANLLAAYKRGVNILAIEEKKDKANYDKDGISLGNNAKSQDVELVQLFSDNFPSIKLAVEHEKFTEAMANLATLRKPIDAFFDNVLINDPDINLRTMRLNILARLRRIFNTIANFAQIEG